MACRPLSTVGARSKPTRGRAVRARLLLLPILALPLACNPNSTSSSSAGAQPATSATSKIALTPTVSAPPPRVPPKARRGGMVGMLFHAARELTLSDAQKTTIDALEEKPVVEEPDAGAPFRDFQADLESGIKAGKIDMTKMKADFAAVDHVIGARQEQDAEALNGLHEALDPAMRKALTASVRAKQAAIDARRPPEGADAGMPDWTKRKVDRMTTDLALDPAQAKQVGTLLAKGDDSPAAQIAHREESKKHLETLLTAFDQDTFDAKKFDLSMGGAKNPHDPMEHEVTYISGLLPILKPDQRDKLAAQRSAKPSFGNFGRPHMGGPGGGPGGPMPGMAPPGMSPGGPGGPGAGGGGAPAGGNAPPPP
jgi:hypothetical protein